MGGTVRNELGVCNPLKPTPPLLNSEGSNQNTLCLLTLILFNNIDGSYVHCQIQAIEFAYDCVAMPCQQFIAHCNVSKVVSTD